MAKGGDDRSLTGITVIHGAYDDSMAQDDSKAGDGGWGGGWDAGDGRGRAWG